MIVVRNCCALFASVRIPEKAPLWPWLCPVMQLSQIQLNIPELQYQAQPTDKSGAVSVEKKSYFFLISCLFLEDEDVSWSCYDCTAVGLVTGPASDNCTVVVRICLHRADTLWIYCANFAGGKSTAYNRINNVDEFLTKNLHIHSCCGYVMDFSYWLEWGS